MKRIQELEIQYKKICAEIREEARKEIREVGTGYRCGQVAGQNPRFYENILNKKCEIETIFKWVNLLIKAREKNPVQGKR